MKFRRLNADEVEVRVSQIRENGVYLLLYKDARVDQNMLDETVGAENWQRSHQLIGNNLYCTVSIYDEDKNAWISKQDVGTESNTEKEKGQASDSFKRACVNWGIGRELYTAPRIKVEPSDVNMTKDGRTYDKFTVKEIGYDDSGNINVLQIYNESKQKIVFVYESVINATEKEVLRRLTKEKGYKPEEIFPQGLELTASQYAQAIKNLNCMKHKDEKAKK